MPMAKEFEGCARECVPLARLAATPTEMRAFLGYRSVVDHQHGIAGANKLKIAIKISGNKWVSRSAC